MSNIIKPFRGAQLNKAHPLAHDIVGAWLLNEGSGNIIFDASGYGHNGAITASPIWAAGPTGGVLNFSLSVDNDTIIIPATSKFDSVVGANSEYTISTWFKTDATSIGSTQYLFMKGRISEESPAIGLRVNVSGVIEHSFFGGGSSRVLTGMKTVDDQIWHHVVATYSALGGRHVIYVDGIEDNSGVQTIQIDAHTYNVSIGSRVSQISDEFDGNIAQTYFWNRALTVAEVRSLYTDPYAMFEMPTSPALFYVVATIPTQDEVFVVEDEKEGFVIYYTDAATLRIAFNYNSEPRREELWACNTNGRFFKRVSKSKVLGNWANYVITPTTKTEAMNWVIKHDGGTALVEHLRINNVWPWAYL